MTLKIPIKVASGKKIKQNFQNAFKKPTIILPNRHSCCCFFFRGGGGGGGGGIYKGERRRYFFFSRKNATSAAYHQSAVRSQELNEL